MHASSPLIGTSRKSLLEMSTTVQRSRLRTSTWAKLSRLSRCACVEELQTSTVWCTAGPVSADRKGKSRLWQVSGVCLKSWLRCTFGEVASDLPPLGNIVIEYDASLVHADAAESLFASEPWRVPLALQHVVHSWCPDGQNLQSKVISQHQGWADWAAVRDVTNLLMMSVSSPLIQTLTISPYFLL